MSAPKHLIVVQYSVLLEKISFETAENLVRSWSSKSSTATVSSAVGSVGVSAARFEGDGVRVRTIGGTGVDLDLEGDGVRVWTVEGGIVVD